VDGNYIGGVRGAFDAARAADHPGPRAIICDTTMCKGVPFLEAREITHFVRVEPEEWAKALAYLDAEAPT
ncbi:MAG: transketolase, partial [Pseudomonadota bacterium]